MAKKAKSSHPTISRSQRDRQVLFEAQRKRLFDGKRDIHHPITELKPEETELRPRIEYTFNYGAALDEPFLVPNPLKDGELPHIQGELRQLVNDTALGKPTTRKSATEVKKYSVDEITDAIKEGIHRWHTYGKER